MNPEKSRALVPLDPIERSILLVRGQKVMLDADLARLYEVTTGNLNKAVKRNLRRFPEDFMFQLTREETALLFQFGRAKIGRGGRHTPPYAFTEHGVAMLSSVLRSKIAVRVNIDIIRTFIRMRHLFATPGEIVAQLQELAKTVQLHDSQIKAITDVLKKMMEPPPEPTRGRFGFPIPKPKAPEDQS